jgi:hypothetical protein
VSRASTMPIPLSLSGIVFVVVDSETGQDITQVCWRRSFLTADPRSVRLFSVRCSSDSSHSHSEAAAKPSMSGPHRVISRHYRAATAATGSPQSGTLARAWSAGWPRPGRGRAQHCAASLIAYQNLIACPSMVNLRINRGSSRGKSLRIWIEHQLSQITRSPSRQSCS